MATDRCSRMSRMYSLSLGCASLHDQQCCLLDSTTIGENPWYDWVGASEASGLDSHWTHTRDQLTRARACVFDTPYGGVLPSATIYNTPETFLPKFYGLICPESIQNWNNPLSVSTCLYISSKTFGGMVQICAPA